MSYDKVQSLSIKKDGSVSIRCATSNVTPISYETVTIPTREGENVGDRLRYVFYNIADGNWDMNPSNKSLVYYYFLKAIEEVEERENILISHKRYRVEETETRKQVPLRDYSNDVFQAFQMHFLVKKTVNLSERVYAVKVEGDRWMYNKAKYGYKYSKSTPKFFPIVQAMLFKRMFNGEIEEKEA